MAAISVIIPSYNSELTIRQCLNSILRQTVKPIEIIVSDSSEDNTPYIIQNEFPSIKLIQFSKKTDPGTARNKAIKVAQGEIIACLDSDCIADRDWIKRIKELHEKYENVEAVGGAVIPANNNRDIIGWAGYMAEFREFLPINKEAFVAHIPTCNISYKKRVFENNASFNSLYYPQEDMIFNLQLTQKNGKILFSPKILVKHIHRSNLKDFFHHQKKIGQITAQLISKFELRGIFFTRYFPFTIPLFPLIALAKWFNTVIAFRKFYKKYPVLLKSLPYFSIGLIYWLAGFYTGTKRKL